MTVAPAPFSIRPATPDDVGQILAMIAELAEFENLGHAARATSEDLSVHLFGPRPAAEVLIAEVADRAEPVGFALYFTSFSTFVGRPGIYLEDLFVRPDWRGQGIGKGLIASVARVATDRGAGRLEWAVLDWNAPAIAFYESRGAVPMADWTTYRVAGDALRKLAGGPVATSFRPDMETLEQVDL